MMLVLPNERAHFQVIRTVNYTLFMLCLGTRGKHQQRLPYPTSAMSNPMQLSRYLFYNRTNHLFGFKMKFR